MNVWGWQPGGDNGSNTEFDIALWGYDRRQVDRCLDELTRQLEEALGQLQLVDDLQTQLYHAQLEIERLRHQQPDEQPPWSEQLATIMATAEHLREQAAANR